MLTDKEEFIKTAPHRFTRLGTWYILALSTIAVIIISGQVLVQRFLRDQTSDSRVVNVAGRQRMLSQKISKTVLLLGDDQDLPQRTRIREELKDALDEWQLSQEGLLHGNDSLMLPGRNSEVISRMFGQNQSNYRSMLEAGRRILAGLDADPLLPYDSLGGDVRQILDHEEQFLAGMDAIVFRYDQEARYKVGKLRKTEYILLGIALLIILLEIRFIFLPTTRQVSRTLLKLIRSEKNAQKMAKEIGALYTSLEDSYQKISHINLPVGNPRLFAKTDRGGTVKFVSEGFLELNRPAREAVNGSIADLFYVKQEPGDFMDDVIDTVAEGRNWRREVHFKTGDGHDRWVDVHIVPVFKGGKDPAELLVLGADLTRQRQAEQDMQKKDRAEIERRINEQKFRSVLILEGQEEERKRIAMNIHDGIGQLLTSLKYHVESLDPGNLAGAREKLRDINELIKEVIQEVRRVTFNLKPPVLSDYGLSAGLKNFIEEVGKLTSVELKFRNQSGFTGRMPSKIENNIFRIVQEAINNAIKYARSEEILVTLSHTREELQITVEDHGQGFDETLLETRKYRIESGHGFFNMYERTEYINGRLDIRSKPGEGTIVKLFVPLSTTD